MKNIRLPLVFYIIPFFYFQKTRLKKFKDWVFHGWNEWLLSYLLLVYASGGEWVRALYLFILGYVAFISFYEIGYIANDFYSVKRETKPRLRFGTIRVSKNTLFIWVIVRVVIFLAISYYVHFSPNWVLFYAALGSVFVLHNLLHKHSLKTFTFLQLAVFRFWAPLFMFIPKVLMVNLFPLVFVFYAFSRTLTYMDSKGLLQLPERTDLTFKIGSSALLLFFSIFWAYFTQSWLCAVVAIYFLLFWLVTKLVASRFFTASE